MERLLAPTHQAPARVAGLFAMFGASWILLGDIALSLQSGDPVNLLTAEVGKGLMFVLLTAVLIHWLVGREMRNRAKAEAAVQRAWIARAQTQRAEALGRLSAGIVHDFNNVLTIVEVSSAALLDDPELRPDQRSILADLSSAGRSGQALVKQISHFSRGEMPSARRVDAVELLNAFVPLLRHVVGRPVRIEYSPPDEPLLLDIAPTHLEQVLLNLASNARDAMPEGGTLSISASRRPGPESDRAGIVRFVVADTGVGMRPETLARCTEPFFSTKQGASNAGLGLATVHSIVGQMDGKVHIESEEGVGTTFTIDLPAAAD